MNSDRLEKRVWFPEWAEVLAQELLAEGQREAYRRVIVRYLHECKQRHWGVSVASARRFMETVEREQQPSAPMLSIWKEGLNWFFRRAASAASCAGRDVSTCDPAGGPAGEAEPKSDAARVVAPFCHAPVGVGHGHSHRAGIAWSPGRGDDANLPARDAQTGAGCAQSAGCSLVRPGVRRAKGAADRSLLIEALEPEVAEGHGVVVAGEAEVAAGQVLARVGAIVQRLFHAGHVAVEDDETVQFDPDLGELELEPHHEVATAETDSNAERCGILPG